jgi:hypothetical protein
MTRVEASNELLQILHELETDSFGGITTGEESRFHHLSESSAMFAKSPGHVIPRTRKEIDVKQTSFTVCFTNRKLLTAEYLPKGQKYNQDYFISDIFPELERDKIGISGGSKVEHAPEYDLERTEAFTESTSQSRRLISCDIVLHCTVITVTLTRRRSLMLLGGINSRPLQTSAYELWSRDHFGKHAIFKILYLIIILNAIRGTNRMNCHRKPPIAFVAF